MIRVIRVRALSFAKFQGILFSFLGLIAGIIYSLGGAIYDLLTNGSVNWGTALAFLALIGMPVLFAPVGFIAGFIQAILFNLFAKGFGGFNLDIEHTPEG